ncbi:MAG: tetratricopeptide repeat protein [Proteobacteria bacterium]|nr:tetratricopeptide repeat protein [Pseudomonadota bacterium]
MSDRAHSPGEAWQLVLQRGLESLRVGRFDDAETSFARAHRLNPDSPEVCYALGRERLRRGDANAAEPLLLAAWQGDRTLASAAGTLARCQGLHLGRFDDAHATLDDACATHRPMALLEVVRSELLLEQGRPELAREHAEAALASAESESVRNAARAALARVCNVDGLAAVDQGDRERALFLFKRAADLDPQWSSPHVNTGAVFACLGNRQRALHSYRNAIEIDANNHLAQLNYGLLLRALGDTEGALTALEQAVECDPSAMDTAIILARAYIDADRPDSAIEFLTCQLDAHADHAELWVLMGTAMLATGQADRAESSWRRALACDPNHAEACLRLADLLTRQARFREATVLAERAQKHPIKPPPGSEESPGVPSQPSRYP